MDDYCPLARHVHTLPEAIDPVEACWCPIASGAVAASRAVAAVVAVVASRAVVAV